MVEAVIKALITICLIVLIAVVVVWVLGSIGIYIPTNVLHILWVILALICILILVRLLRPVIGGWIP